MDRLLYNSYISTHELGPQELKHLPLPRSIKSVKISMGPSAEKIGSYM